MSLGSEGREKRKKGAESLSSFNPKSELEHGTTLPLCLPRKYTEKTSSAWSLRPLGTQELSEELTTSR